MSGLNILLAFTFFAGVFFAALAVAVSAWFWLAFLAVWFLLAVAATA